MQRYARAADERDIEALRSLFHPEASIVGLRGPLGLDEWLDTMRAPRVFPTSMHVLGDPLIDVADDAETRHLDTYAVVYQFGDTPSGQRDLTLGIRYVDDGRALDGRWVVRERRARTLWMR